MDTAFGRFALNDRSEYAAFLSAHARVLRPIEAVLGVQTYLPAFEPRTPALVADLIDLGQAMPPPILLQPPSSPAEAWAMLYVVEGSRLGGVMLARSVGAGLPHAYLSAGHVRGGWRAFLASFDAAAEDEAWMAKAISAARAVFALYARSAAIA